LGDSDIGVSGFCFCSIGSYLTISKRQAVDFFKDIVNGGIGGHAEVPTRGDCNRSDFGPIRERRTLELVVKETAHEGGKPFFDRGMIVFPLIGLASDEVEFLDAVAKAQEMVNKEIVKLIRPDFVFRLLGDLAFLVGGQEFGRNWGGILLLKYSSRKFFIGSVFVALCGLLAMCFASGTVFILITVAVFGVGYANLFSIIFGIALHKVPEKSNEVSALLVSGICGGAILPPIIGMITDHTHTQLSAIITLIVVWCYMLWLIKYIQSE
jgi:hypothetical protein